MTNLDPHQAARAASAAAIRRTSTDTLSMRARVGHVALLLVSIGAAGALAALWLTEPGLPTKTQVAFAILEAILLTWAGFAVWVLRARRALFGRDRIVAARLSVTFSALYTLGMIVTAARTGLAGAWGGAAVGVVMLLVAWMNLARANRHVLELTARRDALERG